jgi:putative transposase
MARLARCAVAGYPHHVVQRGKQNQSVFSSQTDYCQYLSWLQAYKERYALDIWSYCLMPDHVHFICIPRYEQSLARTFNTLHMRYTQYFNRKYEIGGSLWRMRFMSCVLDESSAREEIRFIENNPVRVKLVDTAEDYLWSSARAHVNREFNPILGEGFFLTREIRDWRAYLQDKGNEALLARARSQLRTGRPAGDLSFVRTLEEIVGRRLEALSRGRPRKNPQA